MHGAKTRCDNLTVVESIDTIYCYAESTPFKLLEWSLRPFHIGPRMLHLI